jgi:hypothetical protein
MRITPDYVSHSLTVSLKTEALLLQIKDKFMFIEYPVNIIPHPSNLDVRGNRIVYVSKEHFDLLKECFTKYANIKQTKSFCHAPTFIISYLLANNVDADLLDL